MNLQELENKSFDFKHSITNVHRKKKIEIKITYSVK